MVVAFFSREITAPTNKKIKSFPLNVSLSLLFIAVYGFVIGWLMNLVHQNRAVSGIRRPADCNFNDRAEHIPEMRPRLSHLFPRGIVCLCSSSSHIFFSLFFWRRGFS